MAWVTAESKEKTELKPIWEYRKGADFITVLPNTTRDLALLTGDLDPTKTWPSPVEVWVHTFKAAAGFATVICDKWNEACPFCYENELFKQKTPNYRDLKLKPPYPISSKALVQVYDFQEKRVLWLLAGQSIIEGMDFILTRQSAMFKGVISLTRTGEKLNTKYRVDISPVVIGAAEQAIINTQTTPQSLWRGLMQMSYDETYKKTGVHPVAYFDRIIPQNLGVDISSWGGIPKDQKCTQSDSVNPNPVTGVDASLCASLNAYCETGLYKDKQFKFVVVEVGKSYLQYLAQAGAPNEKLNALVIINNWDAAVAECGRAF